VPSLRLATDTTLSEINTPPLILFLCTIRSLTVLTIGSGLILVAQGFFLTRDGHNRQMSLKREAVVALTADSPEPRTKKTKTNKPSPVDVTLVSYNIWFDSAHQRQRMQALHEAILSTSGPLPRFIGLQEVTASLAATLIPLLESTGYQIVSQQPNALAYGCALALQVDEVVDSGFCPFRDSIMGRGILWAHTRVEGQSILFTTTHLESYVRNYNGGTYTGAPQRESQLQQMKQFCERFLSKVNVAIITGDLNWDDERKKSKGADKPMMDILGDEWMDAWRVHRPKEEGYTYDSKESAMLRGNLRRRFDRCLFCSNSRVTIQDTELIGTKKIPNLIWEKDPHPMAKNRNVVQLPVLPSDHFGLRVTLQLNPGKK
jgi:endonuclease/exonuclease/phosphatase family metal-dependent hydrolase